MEFSEQDLIDLCKARIEETYHAGDGDHRLRQRDFEYLLDLIEETSGIRLSVSTLKRLWRNEGEQNPHPTTLDALVSILGYKDWLDFKVQNATKMRTPDACTTDGEAGTGLREMIAGHVRKRKVLLMATGTLGVAVLLIGLILPSFRDSASSPGGGAVSFSVSNTVAAGVPTTVIFKYDLADVIADSFYIQQDWNPGNIRAIERTSEYFTSVYYLPGFHRARLFANETVLRTEEVFVRTEGWLAAALYSHDEPPVYLTTDRSEEGILSLQERHLLEKRVDMDRVWRVLLFNIRDFGELDGHNFKSETRFRLRELAETPCPTMQFTIHTEANINFVQLTPMGCVGELAVLIGRTYRSGGNYDLSAFGTDIHDWQELSITVEEKQVTVFLNGGAILEQSFSDDLGDVVGVDYRFAGLGDVDYLRLSRIGGTLVFEDEFSRRR